MAFLNKQEKNFLIKLAVQAIKDRFEEKSVCPPPEKVAFASFKTKGASFVTIYVQEKLRGCIGHVRAIQPLYQDIYDNAQAAAFEDPRFPSLTEGELSQLKLEISLLSAPKEISAKTPEEKLAQIKPHVHGVILRAQGRSATFLPQVWQQLPDKTQFLAQLSHKAWLPPDAWKQANAKLLIYTVESFTS
ncbi:AmmeMemoRadiSam system protein A [Patescibacteria group bacterium]|nr:AmmeMemoRadiSam system protein A [Patescibacteria group bacterium]MBU1931451.1 AmmeMemoRadiSam system protein A [Patescibacteria group bacterium]